MVQAPFEDCVYSDTAAPPPRTERLEGQRRADVVLVGAGYTGLSAALHLAERGVEVVVLEAQEIGWGGSGRNQGHCVPTFLFRTPDQVIRRLGPHWGPRMVRLQADSAQFVFDLIRAHGIDCEAAQTGTIQAAHRPGALDLIRRRCDLYASLGKACTLLDKSEVAELTGSERYFGGWLHPEGGHLNPLGYARGLARVATARGARIFTRSPVTRLARREGAWRAETPHGSVAADKVAIATNAYTDDCWPGLRNSCYIVGSYNVATEPLPDHLRRTILAGNQNVCDTRRFTQFYRLDGEGRIVTGGFDNGRRGVDPPFTKNTMSRRIQWVYPHLGDIAWKWYWHGDVAMTLDTLPRLLELAPGVMAVNGYSGRGVPVATPMGAILAGAIGDARPDELPLPISRMRTIPARRLLGDVIPRIIGPYYRWRDRQAMRREGLAEPYF